DQQQDHSADDGIDDRSDDTAGDDKPDERQQPSSNDGAHNTHHDVPKQAETISLDKLARGPACTGTDDEPEDKRFKHGCPPGADESSHATALFANKGARLSYHLRERTVSGSTS